MFLQQGLELLHQHLVTLVGEANLLVGCEGVLLRKHLLERGDLLPVEGYLAHVGVLLQEFPIPANSGGDIDDVVFVQRPQHLYGVAARWALGVLRDFEVESDRLGEPLLDVGALSLLLQSARGRIALCSTCSPGRRRQIAEDR